MHFERWPPRIRAARPIWLAPAYGVLHLFWSLVGLATVVEGTSVAAFWPAGGLLLAACIVCRRRQRWALLAAAVGAELAAGLIYGALTDRGLGPGLTLFRAVAHASVYAVSVVSVERWWEVPLPAGLSKLARGSAVVSLILLVGIAGTVAATAAYSDVPYLSLVSTELAGHILGAMTVTPVVLAWWLSLVGYRGEVAGSATELRLLVASALAAAGALYAWPLDQAAEPVYVFFPILLWAAMRFPTRYVSLMGLGVTAATMGLGVGGGLFAQGAVASMSLLSLQCYLITIMVSALWVSVANYERRRSEVSLRNYAQALTSADDRVRRRVAADIHDGIGQQLVALGMLLSGASRKTTDPDAARTMTVCVNELTGLVDRTRRLLEELDPPWLYEMELKRMVEWLADGFADRSGLLVEVRSSGPLPRLQAQHGAVILRAVRELLRNVHRHSGVLAATVDIGVADRALQLTVADAGRGFDMRFEMPGQLHGGFGLFSLREQLVMHGGRLSVQTSPARGCAVTIVLPC